jgi:hypothetical protein
MIDFSLTPKQKAALEARHTELTSHIWAPPRSQRISVRSCAAKQ